MQAISEYEKRLKDVLAQVQLSEVDDDLTRQQPHLRCLYVETIALVTK